MKTRKGCFRLALWAGDFVAVLLVAVAVFVVIGMIDAPPPDESEYIMLGLRTQRGISSVELEKKYGDDFEKFRPYIKRLVSGGFAREFEDRVHLTARGFLISNTIIGDMLACM